jgi:hypothetical protein
VALGHEHTVETATFGLLGFSQELRGKLRRALGVRLRLFIGAAVGVGHVTDGDHMYLLSGLLSYSKSRFKCTVARLCFDWAQHERVSCPHSS